MTYEIISKQKETKKQKKKQKTRYQQFRLFKMITTGCFFEICCLESVVDILRKFLSPKSFYIYLFKTPCIHYFYCHLY